MLFLPSTRARRRRRSVARSVLCGSAILAAASGIASAGTSFCLDTSSGLVLGTNGDLPFPGDGLVIVNPRGVAKQGFRRGTTGASAQWVSTYGSVTFNLAGREFAWHGMNEAGLVVSSLSVAARVGSDLPEPDERPPFDPGSWVQYVLDTCGNIEDLALVDAHVRLDGGSTVPNHFLAADAQGSCAVIEYLDGEYVVYTGERLPVKALTNMRYERAVASFERGGPRFWWANPERSAERFIGAAERLTAFDEDRDADAVAYAFEILSGVVALPQTRWSVVYDIPAREVWFRSDESPSAKRFALGGFVFSCTAPPKALDVNTRAGGRVDARFRSLDRDENASLFRVACQRFGIETTPDDVANLMDLFESFTCAPADAP